MEERSLKARYHEISGQVQSHFRTEEDMSPQHYTKNTESVSHFCNVCRKNTMHKVYEGRLGPCVEDHHKDKHQKPEREDKQQDLVK